MTSRASGINSAMLRWARERSGYSVEEVARRRQVAPERVREWEAGTSYPTWRQLEDLAHKDYHRATGFFFLNDPPSESTVAAEFRRLPSALLDGLHPDTLYAVRQGRMRQEDLRTLLGPRGAGERPILDAFRNRVDPSSAEALATEVRSRLGIALPTQRSWRSADDALKEWRDLVEESGVWVFKRSFRQSDVAGFCLNDDHFPIIYLNNGQAKTRQIFTLFHELGHLLFNFNHLERSDTQHYLGALSGEDQRVEVACNRFAAELLVPSPAFVAEVEYQQGPTSENLAALARTYRVSREVILRKYRDRDWLDGDTYREMVELWQAEQRPPTRTGGNYYATQATYLGRKYLRAAFLAFDQGRIDESELSACLGVRGSSIDRMEPYAWE